MFRRASSNRVEGLLFRMNWENNAFCKFSSNTGMQNMQIEGKGLSNIIVIGASDRKGFFKYKLLYKC